MSYDIWLEKREEVADIGNYTSNVSGMWSRALGRPLKELEGMQAQDAIPILSAGIQNMMDASHVYKEMNPENGWGNYEGAKDYLVKLLTSCIEYPEAYIKISY